LNKASPAGWVFVHDAPGFLSKDDEHRLRDLLGGVEIAGFPQRGGIDQVHVARNQAAKAASEIPSAYCRNKSMSVASCIH